jgi:hypothetical protein
MNAIRTSCPICNRRNFLTAITSVGAALAAAPKTFAQQVQEKPTTANGSTEPYPIPWLDKNGSHNQPAGPNLEPSHIYDFKGRVARCSTFTGMGTDNKGNRIAFGSPTTDYGVMQGEYWAARTTQGAPSLTNDSPCSRDRWSPPTRFTISTLRLRLLDFTRLWRYRQAV